MNYLFTQTPLAFFVQNLWRDEAFTYLLSTQSISEILRTTAIDFNPPFYYLFMHFWMNIFGSSEISLRSVSLLFYVFTIFIMFEIMVLVFKIPFRRALIYFALIMYNPVLLTYAFEARMYMMAAFFITLSYFALFTKRRILYVFAMTCALYTHYFTILILLAQIVARLPVCKFKIGNLLKIENLKWKIIPVIIFLPWILYLISFHSFEATKFWIILPTYKDLLYLPFVLFTGYQRVFGEYYHEQAGYTLFHLRFNLVIIIILVLSLALVFVKKIKSRSISINLNQFPIVSLFIWSFLPPIVLYIISLFTTPVYHPRYFMFSVGGFLLLIVAMIEYLVIRLNKMRSRKFPIIRTSLAYVPFVCIVIFLLNITHQYNKLNLKYNSKRHISRMFREIDSSLKTHDRVYLTSELDYFLAKYYMKNESIYIFGIAYENVPLYVGNVLIPVDSFVNVYPLYPARTFIVTYDQYTVRSEM